MSGVPSATARSDISLCHRIMCHASSAVGGIVDPSVDIENRYYTQLDEKSRPETRQKRGNIVRIALHGQGIKDSVEVTTTDNFGPQAYHSLSLSSFDLEFSIVGCVDQVALDQLDHLLIPFPAPESIDILLGQISLDDPNFPSPSI